MDFDSTCVIIVGIAARADWRGPKLLNGRTVTIGRIRGLTLENVEFGNWNLLRGAKNFADGSMYQPLDFCIPAGHEHIERANNIYPCYF